MVYKEEDDKHETGNTENEMNYEKVNVNMFSAQ